MQFLYTKRYSNILRKDSNGVCKSFSLLFAIPIKLQIMHEEKVIDLFVLPLSKLVSCINFSKGMNLKELNQLQTVKKIKYLLERFLSEYLL